MAKRTRRGITKAHRSPNKGSKDATVAPGPFEKRGPVAIQRKFREAFETAVEGNDDFCLSFMAETIKLPGCYLPAVQEALRQGRWRMASNPIGYVRTVAFREALKMGLSDPDSRPWEPGNVGPLSQLNLPALSDGNDDHETALQAFLDRKDFEIHRRENHEEPDGYDEDGGEIWLSRLERWARKLPPDLLRPAERIECIADLVDPSKRVKCFVPDWNKIANRVGLDEGERIVLGLRLSGYGRDYAIAKFAADESERLGIQAAWKRFDRSVSAIREVATCPQAPAPVEQQAKSRGFIPAFKALENKSLQRIQSRESTMRKDLREW